MWTRLSQRPALSRRPASVSPLAHVDSAHLRPGGAPGSAPTRSSDTALQAQDGAGPSPARRQSRPVAKPARPTSEGRREPLPTSWLRLKLGMRPAVSAATASDQAQKGGMTERVLGGRAVP